MPYKLLVLDGVIPALEITQTESRLEPNCGAVNFCELGWNDAEGVPFADAITTC
jgi:hypothetical protein